MNEPSQLELQSMEYIDANNPAVVLDYVVEWLESEGFGSDEAINGADLVESIDALYQRLLALRERVLADGSEE